MKKITLFLMVCIMSVTVYAQGGNITYELNGGVTNDEGWQDKADMYQGLYESWNTFKGGGQTPWTPIANLDNPVVTGIPTQAASMDLTFIQDDDVKAKWQWLIDYMDAVCIAQGVQGAAGDQIPSANASYLRYNLSAFFANSVRASWPVSANYTFAGQPVSFMPTWEHGFAGPDSYDGTTAVTIPTPYKAGFSFYGWYKEADFSGEKVTIIPAGEEGDITLYAKWGDYILSNKEVQELVAGEIVTTSGVVTYVKGVTANIQDASAGLLVEFAAAPTIAVGDYVLISGTTAALGADYIKLTDADLLEKENSTLPAAQPTTLAAIASAIFKYITIDGLTITSYTGGNAILSDGTNSIAFDGGFTAADFPVNTKVTVKAVVSYTDDFILVGSKSGVTAAPVPRPEPGVYAAKGDEGQYTLTSKWMVSLQLDNWAANPIQANTGEVRGMTAKNGKMYFPDRTKKQLTVVEGETGKLLQPVVLADDVFTREGAPTPAQFNYYDIKQDAVGNILVSNLVLGLSHYFQVWKIDETTGEGSLLIEECLADNPDFGEAAMRIDAIGVYGDVDADAIVMAAVSNTINVLKWTITGGVAGKAELIIIDTSEEGTYMTGSASLSTAPQIYPVDFDLFFVDGASTFPTLIDMEGNIVDGFFNYPQDVENWASGLDRTGNNGLCEFEVAGDYFFLMAYTNSNVGAANSPNAFKLFKFKDSNKEFKDMEPLWVLPAAGMGSVSASSKALIPSVEVDNVAKTANIYLFAGDNGYGAYEFKVDTTPVGIETIAKGNNINIGVSGNTVLFSEFVSNVRVFNLAGQLTQKAQGVSSINIPNKGIHIVSVQTAKGETVTAKVIIK